MKKRSRRRERRRKRKEYRCVCSYIIVCLQDVVNATMLYLRARVTYTPTTGKSRFLKRASVA